ncbi:hypothetical protein AB0M54_18900 [Actinoplanes sp. NPDC051470]|uniref:hypothetical protein n=1 Tax=unclassified Actinoplanes TaxID=2626549 RepID=UPI0034363C7B
MTDTNGDPRFGAPANAATPEQTAPPRDIKREVNLRQQAVQRLRYMNIQHAMHAWENRYRDPIAAYAMAFLFAQPGSRPEWLTLRAATKLWLAGPEAADLPRLLYDLNKAIAEQAGNPSFDLRRDLANRVDEDMAADAYYVGIGVSSLDTCTGTWEHACSTVDSYEDVPGQIRILMTDPTTIVCDRRGLSDFNTLTVQATNPLSLSPFDSPYRWGTVMVKQLQEDPAHGAVLRWMDELNLSLWRADNARLVARQQAQTSRSHRRQS